MEVTKHEPGMFSWADLGTPDAGGAKRFYSELLGLDTTDMQMGEGMSYTMLSKRGKHSCALYTMPDEMAQMTGGRPAWLSYFTVESADETAPRITELGGTVMNSPFDVFNSGRMVVAMDPTGAMFAAWEPRDHIGAGIFGEPGALAWNELYTHDTEAAARFYGGLFGWAANATPTADGAEYVEYRLNGQSAAGMMAIKKEWGEMPANWSIYFSVADLDASLEKAGTLSGQPASCSPWRSPASAGSRPCRTPRAATSPSSKSQNREWRGRERPRIPG